MPWLANGVPLSVRIAHGNPYWRNVASNNARTGPPFVSGIT